MENGKSKPFFTMTLIVLSLHCAAFHLFLNNRCYLQNIFLYQNISWLNIWEVLSHLFFSMFETRPRWCLLVQNNRNMKFVKYIKYAWKQRCKSWSTIKTQQWREWCCSGVFIVNFRFTYWGPSWISTMELFFNSMDKS